MLERKAGNGSVTRTSDGRGYVLSNVDHVPIGKGESLLVGTLRRQIPKPRGKAARREIKRQRRLERERAARQR